MGGIRSDGAGSGVEFKEGILTNRVHGGRAVRDDATIGDTNLRRTSRGEDWVEISGVPFSSVRASAKARPR